MIEKLKSNLPKIGYLYHYPRIDEPTDKFRLDIFISSIPTEQHFDVLRAHVFVKTQKGAIERLTISHPWNYEKTAIFCAGVVIMEDRKGKKEEAFTFGGKLEIDEQELQTVCILKSPAPILEISGATSLHKLFIDELEIILAKRQAMYPKHNDYEKLLSKADPFNLYRASLKELTEKFEHFPHKDERYFQLLMYLHSQEHRLREAGISIDPAPNLDNIFEKK
jgi:hypothetical protein